MKVAKNLGVVGAIDKKAVETYLAEMKHVLREITDDTMADDIPYLLELCRKSNYLLASFTYDERFGTGED